jgi:hypothetical protein
MTSATELELTLTMLDELGTTELLLATSLSPPPSPFAEQEKVNAMASEMPTAKAMNL